MGRTQRGFTLIELLISVGLGFVVMAAIYNVFISQNRVYEFQSSVVAMNEAALTGIDVMLRDLRTIGYRDSSGNPILLANPKQVSFRADLNDDGTLEQVEFKEVSQEGAASLVRIENAGAEQTLVKHLEPSAGVQFKYYDKDGGAVIDTSTQAQRNTIRSMKVLIAVQTNRLDPISNTYKVVKLETYVRPRNLAGFAAP
ncbi:MAG: prepilin-type N-terminal cleavage/methylation domain-containing protein [Candidatus Tectomicrobia bacterium]|nr:prepilin-type N-terminal cleavage/methylation domain-containing protein [Candidatus Tectomicrobia bacterium]